VGTSQRVVREVTLLPGDPGSLKSAHPRASASPRKRKGFPSSSLRVSFRGYFEKASMLEQHAAAGRNFRFAQPLVKGPEPAPRVLSTGKLYGFPTVSLAPVFPHTALGLSTRQKPHLLPRPREAIPPQPSDSPRCRCFRLARM